MKTSTVMLLIGLSCEAYGQTAVAPWGPEMNAGKAAFSAGKYPEAAERYLDALIKAEAAGTPAGDILPILRAFAAALRTNGDAAGAQQVLERILVIVKEAHGETNPETAAVLSEIAVVQRSQDLRQEAIETLKKAIAIRGRSPASEALARDTTLAGAVYHEMGEDGLAVAYFQMALTVWGMLPDSGLNVLTALDPLAAICRDRNDYARAEELYTWALRLREAALGPEDAELISTIDSLAYVLFGAKKYDEAEVMYKRLLSIWERVGGPEHPMLSLTLDKMTEFYMEQKRYEEAAPVTQRAQAIRVKAMLQTLHRSGRVLVGEKKIEEALDLYERTVRIATDARVPDEEIAGVLTTYAILLRQQQREKDAAIIGRRLKAAMEKTTAKEGKRAQPPAPRQ
ncbi:MAG TPA: tetratricopeptide repeat protein [Bryobacteraceae bacterium]|nr:tetratricopeptide repeat protein [Bryobacteraceae bacterium]